MQVDIDHEAELNARVADDARLAEAAIEAGQHFVQTSITSRADGLELPIYIFEPKKPSTARGALVWIYGGIHDGIHDRFGTNYFPFIRQAASGLRKAEDGRGS